MNQDVLKGKLKQITGEMKRYWGKLTDDDWTRIKGDKDKLIGILQERYGYSRERAMQEVDDKLSAEEHQEPVKR